MTDKLQRAAFLLIAIAILLHVSLNIAGCISRNAGHLGTPPIKDKYYPRAADTTNTITNP